jgi:IS1 family transposase
VTDSGVVNTAIHIPVNDTSRGEQKLFRFYISKGVRNRLLTTRQNQVPVAFRNSLFSDLTTLFNQRVNFVLLPATLRNGDGLDHKLRVKRRAATGVPKMVDNSSGIPIYSRIGFLADPRESVIVKRNFAVNPNPWPTAFVDFLESHNARVSENDSKTSNPPSGGCGSAACCICGCLLVVFGFALLKLSFYIADAPYGMHSWRSRLLYFGFGLCAVICIWQGLNLTFVFIVAQQLLDQHSFVYYTNYMANVLGTDKQIGIIGALCEGSSIRSIERTTGVHRDTIMRLGVKVGKGCTALMDAKMRNLDCQRLEMDEIWGYVGKKEKHVRPGDDPQFGNVWTFCAIDADTKLVPAFRVSGDRDVKAATAFVVDVADRMKNRVQISTDGLAAYVEAIDWAFGRNVDYGQIIKVYGTEESVEAQRRYSAPKITSSEKKAVFGRPDFDLISTSYVERLNATTRLHMKRLARLTYAFSKKRENFEAAVGLHFAYYNFCKRHNTLRCTPAMAGGVEQSFWSVGELLEAAA